MHGGDAGTFLVTIFFCIMSELKLSLAKVLWHLGHGKNYFQRIAYFGPQARNRLYDICSNLHAHSDFYDILIPTMDSPDYELRSRVAFQNPRHDSLSGCKHETRP
jgi:hypothetical protein